jgi:hypothetical protein
MLYQEAQPPIFFSFFSFPVSSLLVPRLSLLVPRLSLGMLYQEAQPPIFFSFFSFPRSAYSFPGSAWECYIKRLSLPYSQRMKIYLKKYSFPG